MQKRPSHSKIWGALHLKSLKTFPLHPSTIFIVIILMPRIWAAVAPTKVAGNMKDLSSLNQLDVAPEQALTKEGISFETPILQELQGYSSASLKTEYSDGPALQVPKNLQDSTHEVKVKNIAELSNLRDQSPVNLKDQSISVKIHNLEEIFQSTIKMNDQEKYLKENKDDIFSLINGLEEFEANLKALIVEEMRDLGTQAAQKLTQALKDLPRNHVGDSWTRWLRVVKVAEKEYTTLYVKSNGLLERLFKRFFRADQWRQERMLRDFRKARIANLKKSTASPHRQLILQLEKLHNNGVKFSREDQNFIHKLVATGKQSKLGNSDLGRFQKWEKMVAQELDRGSGTNTKLTVVGKKELEARAYAVLRAKQHDPGSSEKALLDKWERHLKEQNAMTPSSEAPYTLQFSDAEDKIIQRNVEEYNSLLSDLRRYSRSLEHDMGEVNLGKDFDKINTQAKEVLERVSVRGLATESQKELLSPMNELDFLSSHLKPSQWPSLAKAFEDRQFKLPAHKKAQWIANLITPELAAQLSVPPSFLDNIKILAPKQELKNLDNLQVENLAKIHDELVGVMSEPDKAFQEFLVRSSIRGLYTPDEMKIFDTRLKRQFQTVLYARLKSNPTQEEVALEALTQQGRHLTRKETDILKKLEREKTLTEEEHAKMKQVAIQYVFSQKPNIPVSTQAKVLESIKDFKLGDLPDYSLALFQHLKENEIKELNRLRSLLENNMSEEFSKEKSKNYNQISQILKEGEIRMLDLSQNQANLLISISETELNIKKQKVIVSIQEKEFLEKNLKSLFDLKNTYIKWEPRSNFPNF